MTTPPMPPESMDVCRTVLSTVGDLFKKLTPNGASHEFMIGAVMGLELGLINAVCASMKVKLSPQQRTEIGADLHSRVVTLVRACGMFTGQVE